LLWSAGRMAVAEALAAVGSMRRFGDADVAM
jgi:hypothetical protein